MKKQCQLSHLIQLNRKLITEGRVLSVDPSSLGSSDCAACLWESGELKKQRVCQRPKRTVDIQHRLRQLHDFFVCEFPKIDVLIIERIRGTLTHINLKWSVGVIIQAVQPNLVLEVPPSVWHAIVPEDYIKTDLMDSWYIGKSILEHKDLK